jgi:hypothetical protein
MVSCRGELFRRSRRDETYEAKIRMISIRIKLDDFSAGMVPRIDVCGFFLTSLAGRESDCLGDAKHRPLQSG